MKPYGKTLNIWKRDPGNNYKTLIEGRWSTPEIEVLQSINWAWTEKVDGTNIRVIWDGASVHFRGRSDNAKLHKGLIEALGEMFPEPLLAEKLSGPLTFYGEGYGAGIQKGGGYREDKSFICFDVAYEHASAGQVFMDALTAYDICGAVGVPVVPVVGVGTLADAVSIAREGLESVLLGAGPVQAEGFVVRPCVPLCDRYGARIQAKIKTCDFAKPRA